MRAFCISHVKDVDGVGAAAIVSAATGAEVLLSDYSSLMDDLKKVPEDVDRFVLCDLGSDNSEAETFVERLRSIASHASVTYIDHHFMSEKVRKSLQRAGVKVVHDEKECSSMLAYLTYRKKVPERARMIALLGAVTDYMDDSPEAKKIMEQADRQFILLEATMLAFAMGRGGTEGGFPEKVARELSMMRHPHEIEGVPALALEQLDAEVLLADEVKEKGKKVGRMAYMVTPEHSTGNVAKLLIGAFQVPVGVAMKEKERGWYEVSLRSTSECRVHLGKAIGKVAAACGGSGGGHSRAAGCRVPVAEVDTMLRSIAKVV